MWAWAKRSSSVALVRIVDHVDDDDDDDEEEEEEEEGHMALIEPLSVGQHTCHCWSASSGMGKRVRVCGSGEESF